MELNSYLESRRNLLSARMSELVPGFITQLENAGTLARDTIERIIDFSCSGKMIRGSLVFLGYGLYSDDFPASVLDTAVAMELFQSGLLIHDDIMDRDLVRRGRTTVHHAYTLEASTRGSSNPGHMGASLGICAGDICFFLGWHLIGSVMSREYARAGTASSGLAAYIASELAKVGLAQMDDVAWGLSDTVPSESDVLRMYRYKTARYTFSLPLVAGALLAGRAESIQTLERMGESMGLAFQIHDDRLGIFGNETKTGKPIGSDFKEGKKTLLYLKFMRKASHEHRERIAAIQGAHRVSPKDLEFLRTMLETYGITQEIDAFIQDLSRITMECLNTLESSSGPLLGDSVILLDKLSTYVIKRSH